jgi:tetratricopeptide (TPR) repeat protein
MKRSRAFGFGLLCFALGTLASGSEQKGGSAFTADIFTDKDPKVAATAMLDQALKLAEDGSWERIAVGRAWYLGGEKAKGQQLFDGVTSSRKVEGSDWFRIGRVYAEAGEWENAEAAFDRALSMDAGDDSGMIEYGALANVHNDRAKAEALFKKALTKRSKEFWHWVGAGGSYLGVRPQ